MDDEKEKEAQQNKKKKIEESLTGMFLTVGWLLILGAFAIPAYQAIRWLMVGTWQSLSTSVLFSRILSNEMWAYLNGEPTSWIGLHKILSWICCDAPLFLFAMVCGFIVTRFSD